MTETTNNETSRRNFLKDTGRIAGAAALVGAATPGVYAGQDSTINLALVGCGGRGTGAASNALSVENGPTKLVAMADVFADRQNASYGALKQRHDQQVDVPEDRRFLGFSAYKEAIDCLSPGDVAIFATPCAFRWVHFSYAIEKGVNVFMEKPLSADAPTTRKMMELNKLAKEKNLKCAVGLMCRHCRARGELADRIHNGEIGDVLMLRAYRMAGPTGSAATGPAKDGKGDLEWQIRRFHAFLWASGGAVSDFLIHNIDEGCWAKNDWPTEAKASGGRHYRGDNIDQNFDHYSIEYTYKDGTKLHVQGRTIPSCHNEFATYVHGTKGSAVFSSAGHIPAKSRIYKGQNFVKNDLVWAYPQPEPNPYQLEWDDLIDAIKKNEDYNEFDRGLMASLVTSMGRMAAHTGRIITLDEMMEHDHEFAPNADKLTFGSNAPLKKGPDGKYPVPMPGFVRNREYEEFA